MYRIIHSLLPLDMSACVVVGDVTMLTSLATSSLPMSSPDPNLTMSRSVFGTHGFGSGGGQLM